MKNYYKEGKGLHGGRLTFANLEEAFMAPRLDHPGRRGAPPAGDKLLPKVRFTFRHPPLKRRRRKSEVLRMIADKDGSPVITKEHRRRCNLILGHIRNERIKAMRAAS